MPSLFSGLEGPEDVDMVAVKTPLKRPHEASAHQSVIAGAASDTLGRTALIGCICCLPPPEVSWALKGLCNDASLV